ncbi:putative TAT secreted protein [Stenotrophomonas phage Siara]|uniref:TAT secreted protein n=1 Tax=Stenotrophomonas phage Siara TaxID=2859658 RepID=A0AAE7WN07_9CAUD|nr:putative TAT secreted protein [Stenotrophomonas phage Siara]QYW02060.1 putative TAT secreted protein [Stenotrophomonas phage Siara]
MVDHSVVIRVASLPVTRQLIVALAAAMNHANSRYASTARCSSCSQRDRDKLALDYQELKKLYEYITSDSPACTDAGFREASGGMREATQAEESAPGTQERAGTD